jgi:Galactose oxidase, central domain
MLPAQAHWTRLYPAASPPARLQAASTYDEVRHAFLVFGGQTASQIANDFWFFDGTTWTPIHAPSPPARLGARMTFDSLRGVAVLFGGHGTNGELNDTWEWDGTAWSLRVPLHSPPGRENFAMPTIPRVRALPCSAATTFRADR